MPTKLQVGFLAQLTHVGPFYMDVWRLGLDTEWSTLLVGYPKWKVDVDSSKFPLAKMIRFRLSPVGLKSDK